MRARLPLLIAAAVLFGSAIAARALEPSPRGQVAIPVEESVGAIESIAILCRRDFVIGVRTPGGRLRPDRDLAEEEKLFDTLFDRAVAEVDGQSFPLGVGGGDSANTVYVFAENAAGLLAALHGGATLTLAFDILPETAKNGKGVGFETRATFGIEGLSDRLANAGRACRVP